MAWERLAHVALSGSGDTLDSGTFTAKKKLKVIVHLVASGDIEVRFNFNSDTGNNYAYRKNSNGEIPDGSPNINYPYNDMYVDPGNNYDVMDITNIADKEKLIILHNTGGTAGAGNAPARREYVSKWTNTSAQITKITITNTASGSLDTGSYITVLGAKEPATSDTITTDTFTAKKHLMIQAKTISDGQVTANYRFNADSGSNYARRQSSNGASDGTGTSQNIILAGHGASGEITFVTSHVINEATKEKLVITEVVATTSGAGNAPNRREIVGKWSNTSNAITSVTLYNNDTGSFAEGTELIVWGSDGTADIITTGAITNIVGGFIFEETETGKHYIWNATTSTWTEIA